MYATVEQANAYVAAYYSSTSKIRIAWEGLSGADRQVALNRAEQKIDLLPFKGRSQDKRKAFPREPDAERSLEMAQVATIELALQTNGDVEAQTRLLMRAQGVKSYKIGDLSETYADIDMSEAELQYVESVVAPFLRDWLGGGYEIRPSYKGRCVPCHIRTKK